MKSDGVDNTYSGSRIHKGKVIKQGVRKLKKFNVIMPLDFVMISAGPKT